MTSAEIEIRKLQATFLNTLAVQFVVVGALAPIVALCHPDRHAAAKPPSPGAG